MNAFDETCDRYRDWSTVPLRIALALPLLVHGLGNVGIGVAGPGSILEFAQFLENAAGVPFPVIGAAIVTAVEIVGGFAILVGLFTRYIAAIVAFEMLVATVTVHLPNGYLVVQDGPPGVELSLTLFLIAIALVLTDSGPKLSLDRLLVDWSR